MQYYIIVIPLLLILSALRLHAYSNGTFSKDTTIAHPETGLFLAYVGLYTPSETIIHNSAIFPMTASSCHFLPLSAAENIPSCNITTKKRNKRFIDVIVSVALGTASLALSASNSMQLEHLDEQVALVKDSLSKLSQTVNIYGAQLTKLTLKHIELAEELEYTQSALDNMLPIFEEHAAAIKSIRDSVEQLHLEMRQSFLYISITQISRDELTLGFLSPEDIHKVVDDVIKVGNLTFNHYPGSLPLVQIITNLLVRQQIDFVPNSQYQTNDKDEIGRLVITSFFGVPRQEQTPFYIYKLVTIPFFHENETNQLGQIPRYWGINPANNSTMEWHNPEDSGCNLQLMTTCRDTPPIHTISKHACIDQIIERLPLSRCQIAPVPAEKYFLRQLKDNFWLFSSPESIHCIKIPGTKYLNVIRQTWSMSEQITLPPISLVNVTEGYTIACPGFSLIGRPAISNTSSLVILANGSFLTKNISVMNVHQYLTANMTWFKKKMAEQDKKTLMDFIDQVNAITTHRTPRTYTSFFGTLISPFRTFMSSFGILTSSWVLFGLAAVLLYHVYQCKRRNS